MHFKHDHWNNSRSRVVGVFCGIVQITTAWGDSFSVQRTHCPRVSHPVRQGRKMLNLVSCPPHPLDWLNLQAPCDKEVLCRFMACQFQCDWSAIKTKSVSWCLHDLLVRKQPAKITYPTIISGISREGTPVFEHPPWSNYYIRIVK